MRGFKDSEKLEGPYKTYSSTLGLSRCAPPQYFKKQICEGSPSTLKELCHCSSLYIKPYRGSHSHSIGKLNVMVITDPRVTEAMWQHLPITGKVGIFAIMDSRGKAMTRIL
jgi:hypothetical protein